MAEVGLGLVMLTQLEVGIGEEAVGVGLRGRVGQPPGGSHRDAPGGHLVVPVAPPVEVVVEGPGQLPGVGVEPGGGGLVDGGQQHGMFRGEPGQGPLMVGGIFRDGSGPARCEGDRVPMRVQQPGGGVGGVQVVVEHPVHRRVPLPVVVVGVCLLGGVGAQQVVAGVPARDVFSEQVRPGQLGQEHACLSRCDGGEAGHGGCGEVRAGVQAQQAEQPGGVGAQGPVGPREHGPDVRGQVTAVQGVQTSGALA